MLTISLRHNLDMLVDGDSTTIGVAVHGFQGSGQHLFEAASQNTVGISGFNDLLAEINSTRARCACVVDIVDRDTSHSNLIESTLPAACASIKEADSCLLDISVFQPTVLESKSYYKFWKVFICLT